MADNRKHKLLQDEISRILESYKTAPELSRVVNVHGAFMHYSRDIIKRAVALAQNEDDYMIVMRRLEEETWLTKSHASKYVSVKSLLDQYGWDRKPIKVDSSKLIQSYMVGDQEIKVTNWFNGSVCRYSNRLYMAYRVDAMPWTVNTRIAMCEIDMDSWQPIPGTNWLLDLPYCDSFAEDPRLFIYQGGLHLSYADGCAIGLCIVYPEDRLVAMARFLDKPNRRRMEKNWTFFEKNDELYTVYSVAPHVVYKVNGTKLTEVCRHDHPAPDWWRWGFGNDIGGGTCPVLYGGRYYSFFHSRIQYPEHLRGQIHRQYHMGCYVYDAETFKVIALSKEPLMSGPYIDPDIPHGGNHNFNVFPMSAMFNLESYKWRITAGINDYEIWHIAITQLELAENLILF